MSWARTNSRMRTRTCRAPWAYSLATRQVDFDVNIVTATGLLSYLLCHQNTWTGAQADDRAIKAEGLDNLTESELREACRARGIRGNVYGEGARAFMIRQLSEWLELSLNR